MPEMLTEGLFLHASAVVVEGGAILFLGHSTAGKSTLTRLLNPIYPVLADDAVFATRDSRGVWRVVEGGFRFEDGDVQTRIQAIHLQVQQGKGVPLRACFRLRKADKVKLEPVSQSTLARFLSDAAMEIDVQRKAGKVENGFISGNLMLRSQWFHWAADIARKYPGWNLYFAVTSRESELCNVISSALSR